MRYYKLRGVIKPPGYDMYVSNGSHYVVVSRNHRDAWLVFKSKFRKANREDWNIEEITSDIPKVIEI